MRILPTRQASSRRPRSASSCKTLAGSWRGQGQGHDRRGAAYSASSRSLRGSCGTQGAYAECVPHCFYRRGHSAFIQRDADAVVAGFAQVNAVGYGFIHDGLLLAAHLHRNCVEKGCGVDVEALLLQGFGHARGFAVNTLTA